MQMMKMHFESQAQYHEYIANTQPANFQKTHPAKQKDLRQL